MKSVMLLAITAALFLAWDPNVHAQASDPFDAKCAMCHGKDGAGTGIGRRLGAKDLASADVQKQTDAELIETVTNGKGKMPAYKAKLSADEIKMAVAHVRTFKK